MKPIAKITPRQPALELSGVGVLRGGRWILRLDWQVEAGTCAAILGPNGSGKSTLARIASGYLWPSAGRVSVLGEEFGNTSLPDLRRRIRLVQPAGPYDVDSDLTAAQVVLSGFFGTIGVYDTVTAAMRRQAARVLGLVGLRRVADHPYRTLSSGERIRALIARALVVEPDLLLLDEPTAGLDLLAREQVLATVEAMFRARGPRASGPTVVFITHHVEELPTATSHILLLRDGRAVAAGPAARVLRAGPLSAAYGCRVSVSQRHGRYWATVHPGAWRELLR